MHGENLKLIVDRYLICTREVTFPVCGKNSLFTRSSCQKRLRPRVTGSLLADIVYLPMHSGGGSKFFSYYPFYSRKHYLLTLYH